MECLNKNHVYDHIFEELPEIRKHYTKNLTQCAGCAFDLGYQHGLNNMPHNNELQKLNTVNVTLLGNKVKDPISAYDLGYSTGDKERRTGKKKKWWHMFSWLWSWMSKKKK